MTTATQDSAAERAALEQAAGSNPADWASRVKLAQIEARLWLQSPETANLTLIVQWLDEALAYMPAQNHPTVVQFVQTLRQKGANLGPVIQAGNYARLTALLTNKPIPQPASTPVSETVTPPPAPRPAAQAPRPSGGGRTAVRTIEVGEVTNDKLKAWMAAGQIEELTNAYPNIENFRTRRVVIDKIAEKGGALGAACLLRALAHTHDEALGSEIVKKITAIDPGILAGELVYDANDKARLAVITVMAAIKTEDTVEPLSNALRDHDGHVRAKAIAGLSEMLEGDEGWIAQLIGMIKRDPDPSVRLEAARALVDIGSQEALVAFDKLAKEANLNEALKTQLEALREKAQGGGMAARKAKIQQEERAKQAAIVSQSGGGPKVGLREIGMLGGFALALILIGFFVISKYREMIRPTPPFKPPAPLSKTEIEKKNNEIRERVAKAWGVPAGNQ